MAAKISNRSMAPIATGAAALVILGAGAFLTTNSETLLRTSFSTALGTPPAAAQRIAKAPPISGSEDFWLSAMRAEGGAPITKTVSVGDRISMSLGGTERTLEVAGVAEFTPKVTEIDTTQGPSRFVLVTAKDSANAAARPIRFVMEIEAGPAQVIAGARARAL